MTSAFVSVARVSADILVKSFPAMRGAARIAQRLKCERYSSLVIPPFPTSSMSGSFQWPGPAAEACSAFASRFPSMLANESEMSPAVRVDSLFRKESELSIGR